ncbi:HOG (high osmolarity glycerol) pathway protein [Entomortierella beljakovae]|nr:HOG (high osmolarity glycerol) pathway protein [Entomortierella beljakovae]
MIMAPVSLSLSTTENTNMDTYLNKKRASVHYPDDSTVAKRMSLHFGPRCRSLSESWAFSSPSAIVPEFPEKLSPTFSSSSSSESSDASPTSLSPLSPKNMTNDEEKKNQVQPDPELLKTLASFLRGEGNASDDQSNRRIKDTRSTLDDTSSAGLTSNESTTCDLVVTVRDFAYPKTHPYHQGLYPPEPAYEESDVEEDDYMDQAEEEEEDRTNGHARGLYDFDAENSSELSFREGEFLWIHSRQFPGWFLGEIDGKTGLVPENYVQLLLACTASAGSRILAISYASARDNNADYTQPNTHILLVSTNDYPASYRNVTWSLVSAWERNITYQEAQSPIECHYDADIGVFTLISKFSSIPNYHPPNENSETRPPGGYQFDFAAKSWLSFTLSSDYQWGDILNTFTLFKWPNTSDIYQANIAQSSTGTVNLGMLKTNDDGTKVFVNSGRWELNPNLYGYPVKLGFGNNEIYQIGSIVSDARTGEFRSQLTRIPLSGSNGTVFNPPEYLSTYPILEYKNCTPSKTAVRHAGSSIYTFCQSFEVNQYRSSPIVFTSIDDSSNGTTVDAVTSPNDGFLPISCHLQIFDDAVNSNIWGYDPVSLSGVNLSKPMFGSLFSAYDNSIVISESYNDPLYYEHVDPYGISKLTIGLSVGIPLFIILIISLLVWRYWPKVREVARKLAWSNWKRDFKAKIIEIVSKIDDGDIKDTKDRDGGTSESVNSFELLPDKIEEIPLQFIEHDDEGKILVTPDMDLGDLENEAEMTERPVALDVDRGYMQSVNLGSHPRPAIATSLSTGLLIANGGDLNRHITEVYGQAANSDQLTIPSTSTRMGPSAPQLHTTSEISSASSSVQSEETLDYHSDRPKQNIPGTLDTGDLVVEDVEDYVPPYSTIVTIPPLSLPNLASPSAPPLKAEFEDTQS